MAQRKKKLPGSPELMEDIRIELVRSRRIDDIAFDMATKHRASGAVVRACIKSIEEDWAGLGRATMDDRRVRNIETARMILAEAMEGTSLREKREALALVAKLEGSFPSEDQNKVVRGLLGLAQAAAVGAGTVAGQRQVEETASGPFDGMTPRQTEPEPMGSRAEQVEQIHAANEPVDTNLVSGRLDLSGIKEERKDGSRAVRVQVSRQQ